MIEKMLIEVNKCLPLKISEIMWNGTIFQMWGPSWNFTTLSPWRLSERNKMILGCFDNNSIQLIDSLKNLEILKIGFQSDLLKIDPLFFLSNNQFFKRINSPDFTLS